MKRKNKSFKLLRTAALLFHLQSEVNATPDCSNVVNEVCSQGKHCNGTVGCDCSGFSAKTDGKEWEKGYCKKCGHKKSYHK